MYRTKNFIILFNPHNHCQETGAVLPNLPMKKFEFGGG